MFTFDVLSPLIRGGYKAGIKESRFAIRKTTLNSQFTKFTFSIIHPNGLHNNRCFSYIQNVGNSTFYLPSNANRRSANRWRSFYCLRPPLVLIVNTSCQLTISLTTLSYAVTMSSQSNQPLPHSTEAIAHTKSSIMSRLKKLIDASRLILLFLATLLM